MPGTVRIGGEEKPALLRALRERGVRLNGYAEALFADPRFTTLGRPEVLEIAALSVAEIGFGQGAEYGRIVARALESGWAECPLETGPHLRLAIADQPDGGDGTPRTDGRAPPGSLTVASPPLDDSDDTPKGFYLRRAEGASWLRGYRSWAGHVWSPEDVLVFRRPPRPGGARVS